MKSKLIGLLIALALILVPIGTVGAATTADVTINATPAFVGITVNNATYSFGAIATSSITNTTTAYFTIDNVSTVQTDQTISVTSTNWTGGIGWYHSDTCTPGVDTAGLKANKGGTWGSGDVIVKNGTPNYIAENQAATTDYSFGLSFHAPTSFGDGAVKSIVVRVSAAAG